MQAKTTRAFRTISEAGEELDLQPHVLRFWESKFSQIKPIKRGGGRRFYRPEDIEFLRGIKILLHDEGHPIKDVQKLIRLKGPGRVLELGQSVQKASRQKKVEDTVLVPERIQKPNPNEAAPSVQIPPQQSNRSVLQPVPEKSPVVETHSSSENLSLTEGEVLQRREDLEDALNRLQTLKNRWSTFLPLGS